MSGPPPAIGAALQSAATYGVAMALSRVLNLLALPLFTKYLLPREMGVIALLALIGMVLRLLFATSGPGAVGVVYFRKDLSDGPAVVVWSAVALLAAGSAVMLVVADLASPMFDLHVFKSGTDAYRVPLLVYLGCLALQTIVEPLLLHMQYSNQPGAYARVQLASAASSVGGALYCVVQADLGIMGWVWGQLIGSLVMVGAAVAATGSSLGKPVLDRGILRDLLKLGLPLIPASLAVQIMTGSAPYFLTSLADVAAAGIFGVGYQLGMGISIVTQGIWLAWVPFFQGYAHRQDEGSAIFPGVTMACLAGLGLLTLVFFACAVPVTHAFTAAQYHDAWRIVGPSALAYVLLGIWGMLLPGAYYAEDTGFFSILHSAAALVTMAAHLLLIPLWGLVGAAAAIVIGVMALIGLQLAFNAYRGYRVQVVEHRSFLFLLHVLVFCCAGIWWAWASGLGALSAGAISVAVMLVYGIVSYLLTPLPALQSLVPESLRRVWRR